jgi:hypothetical protein
VLITPAGQRGAHRVRDVASGIYAQALGNHSPTEIKTLIQMLSRLYTNIAGEPPK